MQSAPAFQFKGTGWYVTDYAKKDGAKAATDGGSPDGAKKKPESGDKTDKTKGESTEKPAAAAGASKES